MGIKNHAPGELRFLTYELFFPDGDHWQDQEHIIGPLDSWLKLTTFTARPDLYRDILIKGSVHWKDNNGVEHRIHVDEQQRPRIWGTKGKKK